MLFAYIIEKTKILGEVIRDIKEQYPNHHFNFNLLDDSSLVSIITDQSLKDIAQIIHVPVKNIATSYRIKRLRSINTILFIIEDISIIKNQQLQDFIGDELYEQYFKENVHAISGNTGPSEIDTKSTQVKEEIDSSIEDNGMSSKDLNSVKEYLIPKWNKDKDDSLETYINALDSAKSLSLFDSDEHLIYSSLIKSDQQELIETLSTEARTNLDVFKSNLRDRFGPTAQQMRVAYDRLKQEPEENEHDWFRRCESSYFKSRSMAVPTGTDFTDLQKNDIKHKFISNLYNKEVLRLMRLNDQTDYQQLAKTARNYATSLKDLEMTNNVNHVEASTNQNSEETDKIQALTDSVKSLVLKIEEKSTTCFKCGYVGHLAKNCRASSKTIAQYNKRKSRRSYSRDRSNSRGRSSSRTRYPSRNSSRENSNNRFNSRERYSRDRGREDSRQRYRSNSRSSRYRSSSRSPGRTRWRSRSNDRSRYVTDDEYYTNRRDRSKKVRFSNM